MMTFSTSPPRKNCFIGGPSRACDSGCVAYVDEGKTSCRLLNTLERLIPVPSRPLPPKAPV